MPSETEGLNLNDLVGAANLVAPNQEGAAAAQLSRCDEGTEIEAAIVPLQMGQNVNLRVVLCGSAFRLRVFLKSDVIFDQSDLQDEVNLLLPPLSPGFHSLVWAYLPVSSPWKTRSEVSVNGLVRFCLKKGSTSDVASNQLMLLLQVV